MQWSNVGETEILIEPTKTRDSSGAKIAVEITPDIKAVLERARAIGKVKSTFVFHVARHVDLRDQVRVAPRARSRRRDRTLVPRPRPKALSTPSTVGYRWKRCATRRRMHGRHY